MKVRDCIVFLILSGCVHSSFATTVSNNNIFIEPTHWYDRIKLSGAIKPTAFGSNRTPTTMGLLPEHVGTSSNASDFEIYNSYLIAEAQLSNWIKTNFTIDYAQQMPAFVRSPAGGGNVLFVDKAYIVLANPCVTPFYAKFGRQFLNFGGLDASSLLESPTQLLSLTRVTYAEFGFTDVIHFNGGVYAFKGIDNIDDNHNRTRIRNYGFFLSNGQTHDAFSYQLGVGYIANIAGSIYTLTTVANDSNLGLKNAYTHAVPGLDVNAMLTIKPFDASVKYIGALKSFAVKDIPFTDNYGKSLEGSRPQGWGINVGYSFKTFCRASRFGVGYQGTSETVALGKVAGSAINTPAGIYGINYAIGIPKTRFYANYSINLFQSFDKLQALDFNIELANDKGYSDQYGGTGDNAYTGVMQLVAKYG